MSRAPVKIKRAPAISQLGLRILAAGMLAALLFGVPAFLAYAAGWPLPTTLPTSWANWEQLLTTPLPEGAIFRVLIIAAWLLWATFVHSVIDEARLLRRRQLDLEEPDRPRRRFSPIRGLAGLLVAMVAAGTMAAGTNAAFASPAAAAGPPYRANPAVVSSLHKAENAAQQLTPPAKGQRTEAPALPAGLGVLVVNGCPYLYEVQRGDTLWDIAQHCLGDPHRWTEIWDLNQGRYWLEVSGYSRLNNPNVIYPRWTLELPADATPPPDTQVQPTEPTPPSVPSPSSSPTEHATPAPTVSMTPSTGPVVAATPAGTPSPTTHPPSPSPTPSPTSSPVIKSPTAPAPQFVVDDNGVQLLGGWMPWALAAALCSAAAVVWLQRRRLYRLDRIPDEMTNLPEPIPTLQRTLRRAVGAGLTAASPSSEPTDPASPWPAGGVGLVGEGAPAAARAAIVAALASGDLTHPDSRTEVIIDAPTLAVLFGNTKTCVSPWGRLSITSDSAEALTFVDERILHRSRILDEHSLTDIDTLRERAPSEEALPRVLQIAQVPDAQLQRRSVITNKLGSRLNITTIYLGAWPNGVTIAVAPDGTTDADGVDLHRVAVLDEETAAAAIATFREAHTGDQTSVLAAASHSTIARPLHIVGGPDEGTAAAPASGAILRTMGRPGIDTITRGLRAKAAELAVYLACHPDGAAVRDAAEYLLPEVTLHAADQQIHTNASNLRQTLAKVGGRLLKQEGRYRLDPGTVNVDIWRLRHNLRVAADTDPAERRQLLQEACDLCTGPLAENQAYEWVEPYAEAVRRWATKAHLLLAEELLLDDPQAAANLLAKGTKLDRYNEQLYCAAMRAHHALHDAQGIRSQLRMLTKVLAELDAQPDDASYDLAKQLLSEIKER